MNFDVKDARLLLTQVDTLEQVYQNLANARENLYQKCVEISNAWQSDAADRDKYITTLTNSLRNLSNLIEALVNLASSLDLFARQTISAANNG